MSFRATRIHKMIGLFCASWLKHRRGDKFTYISARSVCEEPKWRTSQDEDARTRYVEAREAKFTRVVNHRRSIPLRTQCRRRNIRFSTFVSTDKTYAHANAVRLCWHKIRPGTTAVSSSDCVMKRDLSWRPKRNWLGVDAWANHSNDYRCITFSVSTL